MSFEQSHLTDSNVIDVPDYMCFGQSYRSLLRCKVRKGFGGKQT